MPRPLRLPVALLAATAFTIVPHLAASAGDLVLERVMLSSGGIAYVEYAAPVDGPATLGLDVPLDQVDDLLASLVVFDAAGGVAGLELPGRDGARAAFGDVPFGAADLESALAFLGSLRGVELEVTGPRPMTGRLVTVERVTEPAPLTPQAGAPVARTRVTLLGADGIGQFILEDANTVRVTDPALSARIAAAIAALRGEAGRSTRHVTVRLSGGGSRTVRVGYVAEAALWKASYRLMLPRADEPAGRARLQGWAVLENTTGADWNGVALALQYGNPVSFRQALYRSYFVTRPEVPVEIMGRILPALDTGALRPSAAPAPAPAAAARVRLAEKAADADRPAPIAPPATPTAGSEGAVDTLFTLPHKVILGAGHTASLPIIDREVSARRVGLVERGRAHPLAAVLVTNDSETSLPAGVLTLYDAGSGARFAGDARLGGLPRGETRLLAFAEDLRTRTAWQQAQTMVIASLTAAAGVVDIQQRHRTTFRITLAAPAGEARDLLVEIPRAGDTLVPPPGVGPIAETATAWRLPVHLAAGEERELAVHVDRLQRQRMALVDDDRTVAVLLGMEGLDPSARAKLNHLADLRRAEAGHIAERDRLIALRAEAEHDEDRIRKNLGAVPDRDPMHARLLRQLDATEARIGSLTEATAAAARAATAAHAALTAAIAGFTL